MAPNSVHESILEFLNSATPSRRAGGTRLCLWIDHVSAENSIFL
jgi:hypothetical protein